MHIERRLPRVRITLRYHTDLWMMSSSIVISCCVRRHRSSACVVGHEVLLYADKESKNL